MTEKDELNLRRELEALRRLVHQAIRSGRMSMQWDENAAHAMAWQFARIEDDDNDE